MQAVSGPLPRRADEWVYEVKWDGMRALATIAGGRARLRTRTGTDVTSRYPELAGLGSAALDRAALDLSGLVTADACGGDPLVIDGEIVMFDEQGRPSFGALQHRMHVTDEAAAQRLAAERSVMFVAFDVLWTPAGSLLTKSYDQRRDVLSSVRFECRHAMTPAAELGDPDGFVEFCRGRGLEGVVAKRRDSAYRPGRRSDTWVKSKFFRRQEFLVIGWTEGSGGRAQLLGALLLGYYDTNGRLAFAGKVGTGFSDRELADLRAELDHLSIDGADVAVPRQRSPVHFVEPTMVVEVSFVEWSEAGHLRHPAYQGRRMDVDARRVVRERDS